MIRMGRAVEGLRVWVDESPACLEDVRPILR